MATARGTRTNRALIWIGSALLVLGIFFVARRLTRTTIPVSAFTVERGSITSTLSTNGKLQPAANYESHAPFAALVKTLDVHEGDRVHKGQLLLTLDDVSARARLQDALAALDSARLSSQAITQGGTQEERLTLSGDLARQQAELQTAQASLASMQRLAAQGAASPSEVAAARDRVSNAQLALRTLQQRQSGRYDQADLSHARVTVADAQAQVAAAQSLLDAASVRAPIDGTVYSLSVERSQFVQTGDRLLQMADLSNMQVVAYFDEPDIGKLSVGQPVAIVWSAKPDRTWHGHITLLPSTIIAYTTRNVGEVYCNIDNTNDELLPDTNVTVTATVSNVGGALFVPRDALHTEGGLPYVYRIVHNRLKRTLVSTGTLNLTQVQILSGVNTGDSVALGSLNLQPLTDGAAVEVTH